MPLKLMYITNDPEIAAIAETAGVDRIFVDMEYLGKAQRQGGMNTVQSHHTVGDVQRIRSVLQRSQLLVRCNPIHEESPAEIEGILSAGADLIMLPYFKTVREVQKFTELVRGRVRTVLLLETPEAAAQIEGILAVDGIDEVHIGLNDLSLGYGKKFMFELLTDGTVEQLCLACKRRGIPYGFGGIASLGKGLLPAEYVIREHYRLGSRAAILSRSFCNAAELTEKQEIEAVFQRGLREIRQLEAECEEKISYFRTNEAEIRKRIRLITEN